MPTQVSPENVEKTIFDGLVELGTERDQLARDASLEDLDVDSLDLVELAQIVEDEYGVEIADSDLDKIETVSDVVELITSRSA